MSGIKNRWRRMVALILCVVAGVSAMPTELLALEDTSKNIVAFETTSTVLTVDKRTLNEVLEQMPKSVDVITEDGSKQSLPATWQCQDDYENTEYDTYAFEFVVPEGYIIDPSVSMWDIPYVEVHIRASENPNAKVWFTAHPNGTTTIDEVLGTSREKIVAWLSSHEEDDYYLGTPYWNGNGWTEENCTKPNGEYGSSGQMNCTGFVAHVFLKSGASETKMHNMITWTQNNTEYNSAGGGYINASYWYWYVMNNSHIKSYEFDTIKEALNSGLMQKGDLVFFQPSDEAWNNGVDSYGNGTDCHIGFFWGETSSQDRFWHSAHGGSKGVPGAASIVNGNQITVLSPKCESRVYVFPLSEIPATLKLKKTSEDGNVSDISFTIKGEGVNKTVTTNKNGVVTGIELAAGTYTITEIVPNGYEPQESQKVTLKAGETTTVTFKNTLKTGELEITKSAFDGKKKGFTFRLTGTSITGETVDKTAETDKNGVAVFKDIPIGNNYTVQEVGTDNYYVTPVSQKVKIVWDKTTQTTFENAAKEGSLKVVKSAEDNAVQGVKFRLHGTSLSGVEVDMVVETNEKGIALFEHVLISNPDAPYILEEVDTNKKYVVPAEQHVSIQWNKVTESTVNNVLKKFTVTVTKKDAETGKAKGDGSLAGAVYGIYNGNTLVDTYTTDSNGQFTTNEYICGSEWTIKEITPSEGYLLNETVYEVGADAGNFSIESNAINLEVTEQVLKGQIQIVKHADDGSTQIETPEVGAEFQVYRKAYGTYDQAPESERDYLVTDEDGYAISKDLPYGMYTVHQTKGIEGAELIANFDVYIDEDGKVYRYLINDQIFNARIQVVKKDSETGNIIPLEGAGFQIYDENGNLVKMTTTYPNVETLDTFYTGKDGNLITPGTLSYGDYTLIEVQAPYGYVLDPTPVDFTVSKESSSETEGVTVITVTMENTVQKGIIKITKSGEVYADVANSGDDEILYTPVYEVRGLIGAVYEVRADEDIVTPDGTLRYAAGESVDTLTTNEEGIAQSKELYLGKYQIVEKEAPYGMILNEEVHIVELTYAGQEAEITETTASVMNERQKLKIILEKEMEGDDQFGIAENAKYQNVKFGVYAEHEIKAANGKTIPKDGLVDIFTVNADGYAESAADLPLGSYYVKEYSTDEAYVLDETKYPVAFEYAGQNVETVILKTKEEAIMNELKRGRIEGIKQNENGDGLASALIGLFMPEVTEYTEENAIMTAVTAEDGSIVFDQVPYGKYYVREIVPPEGYLLNTTPYEVIIPEKGHISCVVILNDYIRGNIMLTKVDADYPENHLNGAVFEVYNTNMEPIGTLQETTVGVYTMENVVYGTYYVKEVQAPDGFYLDEGVYEVSITEHGKTYIVENNAGGGFINEIIPGELKIIKHSEDGILEGFTFQILGPDGYSEMYVTNDMGEILIENLRPGEYIVSEVGDEKTERYILPEEVSCAVEKEEVTVVEFTNELIRGDIMLTKVDEEYPDHKLTGAVFEVTDEDGEILGEMEEVEKGIYVMEDLPFGYYEVQEVKAPEGYYLDSNVYGVFISEDEALYEIENEAGVGFVNQRHKGSLRIFKTSDDGKIEGFSFRITSEDGYDQVFITNKDGEIVVEGLRIGEYTVSEVCDSVSEEYDRPEKQTVKVTVDETVTVKMHNSVFVIPQTGDTSNLTLWAGLAGLTAVALGCVVFVMNKRKKKQ